MNRMEVQMSELVTLTEHYYKDELYNCSEAVLHAANDYYDLQITEDDMKMIGGFGAGMFSGFACGALSACVAVISKMVIQNKVREEMDDVKPKIRETVRIFRDHLGGTSCPELRPKYFTRENLCLQTTLLAAEALETAVRSISETQ